MYYFDPPIFVCELCLTIVIRTASWALINLHYNNNFDSLDYRNKVIFSKKIGWFMICRIGLKLSSRYNSVNWYSCFTLTSIRGDAWRLNFWDLLLNCIKNWLSGWKNINLFLDCRLISLSCHLFRCNFFPSTRLLHISFLPLNFHLITFFEVVVRILGKFLGLIGIIFVWIRSLEVWGTKEWRSLILLF